MHASHRKIFNEAFTPALYESYRDELESRLRTKFAFRLAETPLFFPEDLKAKLVTCADEILTQLMDPVRILRMKKGIPYLWDMPGVDALPSLTQIDLAVVREKDGTLAPRLIELQGFPSLVAMQTIQRDVWVETLQKVPGLDGEWSCWFNGLDRERFLDIARRTILGDQDPAEVILLDVDPPTQKTFPDFVATKILFGVDHVCPSTLTKREAQLFRTMPDGSTRRVKRIYNRIVVDGLIQSPVSMPFDYRDILDVEWAPHPNWFWIWSKYSLPFLDHPAVPRTKLLSEVKHLPDDLTENYVLKPLFSFAGGGVNVQPTKQDVARISDEEKPSWCLQEKIYYEPALQAADGGGVKLEVRMMYMKPRDMARPLLCENLVRLSRGEMMGVDFNKGFSWVGSSVGLWRP